jgi:hypothetical protein
MTLDIAKGHWHTSPMTTDRYIKYPTTPVLKPAQLRVMADIIERDNPEGTMGVLTAQGNIATPGCTEFATEVATYLLSPEGGVLSVMPHAFPDEDDA